MTIAHSGRAEGGFRSEGPPEGAVQGPPLIPPPRGGPATPTERACRGGARRRQEGGQGREPRAPPRGGAGRPRRDPPHPPPPPARKPRGRRPPPPEAGGMVPPPSARERCRNTARFPAPAAGSHRNRGEQASPRQRARTPHRSRPEKVGEHEPEWYGNHAPHDQNDARDTRFVACSGKAEGRNEAERLPALLATPAAQAGGTAHGPPPPPPPKTRRPAHERHGPARRGAHSPKPGRGEPGPDRPPPKHARRSKGPGRDTRRGTDHVERPYQRPAPGPREVRTPHHPGGGGADAAGARAHTHARGTRGLPEGQPDQARGTHRSRGMAYQRARVRDTRTGRPATRSAGHAGREGGNGRDTTPGTGPSPPNRLRAPRTHGRGTVPAKAVVAHCATPQPLG